MHFLPEELDNYIVDHTENEPALLKELNKETYRKILQPRMLSGAYQGRVLSMISKIRNPKNILEIGTFTGYSALSLAEGMQKEGELHTVEIDEELFDFQKEFFEKSKYKNQIHQHLGNALEIVPSINKEFDLVFIDADKDNYINYFNIIIDKLTPGAIILSDNVLWSGKVIEPLNPKDETTKTLLEYNKLLKEDPRVETVLLPIRDGLTISRKVKF